MGLITFNTIVANTASSIQSYVPHSVVPQTLNLMFDTINETNPTLLITRLQQPLSSCCVQYVYLCWEAWLEEHKHLPALWMRSLIMSWPGGQRWVEPTEMSDLFQPLLTVQLERKQRRELDKVKHFFKTEIENRQ